METTISESTEQRNTYTTGKYGKSSINASSPENQYQRMKSLASGKRMKYQKEDESTKYKFHHHLPKDE